MALTRVNQFDTGTVVTETALEGEFDNIYNNALTLISPLTANLAAGGFALTGLSLGTVASPGLQFTGDTNTGIYSPAADQLALVVGGGAAAIFTVGAVGPHAIGGAVATGRQLTITGAFTPASGTETEGLSIRSTLTPFAGGGDIWGIRLTPTLVMFSSGLHPTLAGVYIQPSITAGAATVTTVSGIQIAGITAQAGTTNAAGLYISAAPSGATNNFALWVDAGVIRWDDPIALGGGAAPTLGTIGGSGPAVAGQNQWLRVNINGTVNYIPVWQ